MSAEEIAEVLKEAMREATAEHSLDLTNPDDVVKLSTDMVAMMWDVAREDVHIDHAVILDEVLHIRGKVRTPLQPEWIEISLNPLEDQ